MMQTDKSLLSPAQLLAHWQGHRHLTRRTIEAFTEEGFTAHHAPEMRTFQEMVCEMAGMLKYQLEWLRTGKAHWEEGEPKKELPSREEILKWWDKQSAELDEEFPKVSIEQWLTPVDSPFGKMSPLTSVLYLIDNEVHHRGQGYVYLRELGIAPPPFYE